MPVLFQNFRANHYSRRHTVYSKIKRVTDNGYDTSNDFFGNNFTGNILGVNDNSKDFFSGNCNDIISFNNMLVACGQNKSNDSRTNLSTFLYSTDDGVSWAFGTGAFPDFPGGEPGRGFNFLSCNNTLFCTGNGGTYDNRVLVMKSTDGITWSNALTGGDQPPLFFKNTYATNGLDTILICKFSTIQDVEIQISTNGGTTFSQLTISNINNESIDNCNVYYIDNKFYALISTVSNNYFLYSTDNGSSWSSINGVTGIMDVSNMFYTNGFTFLFLNNVLYDSTDGINFQSITLPITVDSMYNITYITDTYYLVSDTGVLKLTDGTTNWNTLYTNESIVAGYVDSSGISLATTAQIFINIQFDGTIPSPSLEFFNNPNINIITKGSSNILVGLYTDSSGDNTIYYQGPNDTSLQATEHQDDV